MTHTHALSLPVIFCTAAVLACTPSASVSQLPDELRPAFPVPLPLQSPPAAPQAVQQQTPPTHEQIADALVGHQRYQAAIEEYKQEQPATGSVWNKMGVAYQLLYNNTDAARCYQMAHKLEPKSSIPINNLGSVAMAQKQYGNAQKLYRKAAKIDPASALYRKNLGTSYLSDHQYKKGWEAYREALKLDPNIFSRSGGVRIDNPSSAMDRGAMNYYMAKGCVLAGKHLQAIEYLRLAMNEGFTSPKKIIADSEFAVLRDMPAFQELMESQAGR